MKSELISQKEAAKFLGLREELMRQWRWNGKETIPCVRIGRKYMYSIPDLEKWITSKKVV